MSDVNRRTCPNCGASPREDRYAAHVDACTSDPPCADWYWSRSWRNKINLIVIGLGAIVLSYAPAIYNTIEEAYEEVLGE